MNNEEKILGLLENAIGRLDKIETAQTEMRTDVASMKTDITSMKTDIDSIKVEQTGMRERMVQMDERLEHVDERTRHTGVLVESTLVPNVQLLFEGHVTIQHQMENLPDVIQLKEDVGTLRVAVKILGDDVAVLKKAI